MILAWLKSMWRLFCDRCPDCGEPVVYYGINEYRQRCIACGWPEKEKRNA